MRLSDWSSDVCSSDLLTLVGKSLYRELSVVRHFGGLDVGRSLHDLVGVARAFQHANIERGLHRAAFHGFQLGQLGHCGLRLRFRCFLFRIAENDRIEAAAPLRWRQSEAVAARAIART